MKPNSTSEAFDMITSLVGESAALDYMNELIAGRLAADYPELDEMPADLAENLWNKYCQDYTGDKSEELLDDLLDLLEELEAEA